jgi:hypothetical protein
MLHLIEFLKIHVRMLDLTLVFIISYPHRVNRTTLSFCYRAGAVGINLTQANRIFLMEPSFNPALEAQAIGRCHRLGQKRPVETIRLIIEDSIESRMSNFIMKKYGRSAVDSSSSSQLGDDADGDAIMKKENVTDEYDTHVMVDESLPGNLATDRAKLMVEEFDLLFGVKDSVGGVSSSTTDSKLSC